ncbi:ATP-binding protein [Treponema zioleckii]|uniref:ATP-binding protein n=1 Tax=Treponema zioleckii TaxID=331680 RepID=UPI00168BDE74|nr:ATP-binding protein [Treponema zioleckii]
MTVYERIGTDEIISLYKDKPIIKVIQGIRRCGKSFMLSLIERKLLEKGVEESQIFSVNFEDFENSALLDAHSLYDAVKKRSSNGKKLYLLFDEIQECDGWEKCVNSLYSSKTIETDIYITGSNANLLSSELATYLSGRYVIVNMRTLSYKEFLYFNDFQESSESFKKFMTTGGFPGLNNMMESETQIRSYLEGIYSTVLLKDIIKRNKIRETSLLEKIILYTADNVGNIFSAKRISNFMKENGRKISVETVYSDLQYLQDAFVLHKVQRYDIRGKKILETMEKYYFADQGLLFFLHGYKDTYINGILENIVYLELLRRGFEVFIGKLGDTKIDFIAKKGGEVLYIQVSYLLVSEETKIREYRPLQAVNDNFPKLILTMDELPESNEGGIVRKNIREWLLNKN